MLKGCCSGRPRSFASEQMDVRTEVGGCWGRMTERWPFAQLPKDPHLVREPRGRRFGGGLLKRFGEDLLALGIRDLQRQHACCVGDRYRRRLSDVHVLGGILAEVPEEQGHLRA